jgi:hypothetical protein
LRARPGYFVVLALWIWLAVTYDNTPSDRFALVLATEALLFTASIYLLRLPELTCLGQGYLILAQLVWLYRAVDPSHQPMPWWNPAMLIAITLAVSHWWQKQKIMPMRSDLTGMWQAIYALSIVGVIYFWQEPRFTPANWLAVTCLLALVVTGYGVWTRAWWLALCGQIFLAVSIVQFAGQLLDSNKPEWWLALAPIVTLGLLVAATLKWFEHRKGASSQVRDWLLGLATGYRWMALLMTLWWVKEYIPTRERIWVLGLLGLAAFLGAGAWRSREGLLMSGVFSGVGLLIFFIRGLGVIGNLHTGELVVYLPNLGMILVWLAQQRIAQSRRERFDLDPAVHAGVIVIGGLALWLFLSCWVLENASGFYLTASWSVFALALFAAGILMRERVYRWLGLGVLACSLGRIIIFDVWKLETIYRILSFMALGIVLLLLGFVYNKYQEKIREWL